MTSRQTQGILFIIGVLLGSAYLLYWSLPYLIVFAGSILYLSGFLLLLLIAIVAFIKAAKWFLKK